MLTSSFYERHCVKVAQDLVGQILVFQGVEGIITETEAYRGSDDAASHAFKGPTPRSQIMFGPPGYSYVYLIYGMYYCLNITTEPEHSPSAVLIRGLKLPLIHLNGPGKVCRHLNITKAHHGIFLNKNTFHVKENKNPISFTATPRIGIKRAQDKLWRFVLKDIPS